MLNGALGTITSATINQRGVSLINTGWGRKWDLTHITAEGASVSDQRLKAHSFGTQPAWQNMVMGRPQDGWAAVSAACFHACIFFVRTYMDQSLPFFFMCISPFLLTHTPRTYISLSRGRQQTLMYPSVCIFAPLCRLLRLNRPAFEQDGANSTQRGSIPLGGEGDDNALLKYNTLHWHCTPTMYIPLYMTACDSHIWRWWNDAASSCDAGCEGHSLE